MAWRPTAPSIHPLQEKDRLSDDKERGGSFLPIIDSSENQKVASPAGKKKIKLYSNKVFIPFYKRYVDILPPNEQILFQPYEEIDHREEEIALQFVYGEDYVEDRDERIAKSRRMSAVRRYNKVKEEEEEEKEVQNRPKRRDPLMDRDGSVGRIVANYKSPKTETAKFGLTTNEKKKVLPAVAFLNKLHMGRKRRRILSVRYEKGILQDKSRWDLLRNPLIRNKLKNFYRNKQADTIRSRFVKVIQLVLSVQRFITVISAMSGDTNAMFKSKRFTAITAGDVSKTTRESQKNVPAQRVDQKGKLLFDPNKYKLTSKSNLSQEVLFTLTKPWFNRTQSEIEEAMNSLQVLKSFAELPIFWQKSLATVAWYSTIPEDKVIIRQSHVAQDYYFLLSGKVNRTQLYGSPDIQKKGEFRVVKTYHKDSIFGVEALTYPGSERLYSVVSLVKCEVLSINIHDYIRMKMRKGEDEDAPEHIHFISNLAFLENFPTLKLLEEAEGNVYLAYFRTGKVVTASTKFSVFVYVVKYGSCRALVELSPPGYKKGLESETKEDESKPLPPSTVPKSVGCVVRPSLKTQVVQLPGRLSSLNIPLGLSMERAHQLVTEIVDKPTHSPSIALDRSFKAEADMYRRRSMNMTRRGSTALQNQKRNSGDKGERGSIQLPIADASIASSSGSSDQDDTTNKGRRVSFDDQNIQQTMGPVARNSTERSQRLVGTKLSVESTVMKALSGGNSTPQNGDEKKKEIHRKPHLPFRTRSKAEKQKSEQTPAQKKIPKYSRWKLLRCLEKGDYIGNEWLNYNIGPYQEPEEDASIVSDGCELVMIRKSFLFQYLGKLPL